MRNVYKVFVRLMLCVWCERLRRLCRIKVLLLLSLLLQSQLRLWKIRGSVRYVLLVLLKVHGVGETLISQYAIKIMVS